MRLTYNLYKLNEKDPYIITSNSWNRVAKRYEEKFMDIDLYDETYDLFLKNLADSSHVLDIGCGPGNISTYLLNKNSTLSITGVDLSANMIELAKKKIPEGAFEVLDVRDVGTLEKIFQGIVCGFCIPYLAINDVQKLLVECYEMLAPGGVFYLSFVDGKEEQSGYITGSSGDSMYFYYHDLPSILGQLKNIGFSTCTHIQIEYDLSMEPQVHEVILATK